MSNFTETVLATLTGIAVYYLLEGLFYEIKARIRGNQYIKFLEDEEDEFLDN